MDTYNFILPPDNTTADDGEDFTNGYHIASKYQGNFNDIIYNWRATPLAAYNSKGGLINQRDLEVTLRGSLALVYFQLKHYSIRGKPDAAKEEASVSSNTITATAIQVKILESATKPKASPYRTQLMKGPIILPQSPTKRKDQGVAVNTFHRTLGTTTETSDDATMTKAEGKKRAIDEDGDTTATDEETSAGKNQAIKKKKKKQTK
jgi:hypothetical protein